MTVKLLGVDDITPTGNTSGGYFCLSKFTAIATGTLTEFKIKSAVAGNAKVAIYADNSGEPGNRLNYNNTGQAVVIGWNTLIIPETAIVKDTVYWLAFNVDTTGAATYKSDVSYTFRYKAATYSTFTFPDPAGSGFSSYAGYEIVAGWGGGQVPTCSCGYIIG